MNGTDPRLETLLEGVERDVPPARDLWPEIEARLATRTTDAGPATAAATPATTVTGIATATRRTFRPRLADWRHALAASLAAVAVAAGVGWQLQRVPPGGGPVAAAPSPAAPAAHEAEYRRVRAELEATFHERLALLAPETRARVLENLEIIRRAEAEIREALAADPASPVLRQLEHSTRRQELELYATIGRSTEPALTRTTT